MDLFEFSQLLKECNIKDVSFGAGGYNKSSIGFNFPSFDTELCFYIDYSRKKIAITSLIEIIRELHSTNFKLFTTDDKTYYKPIKKYALCNQIISENDYEQANLLLVPKLLDLLDKIN